MDTQISLDQIKKFSKKYNEDENNKLIESAITKNGIDNVCINNKVIQENVNVFNIVLPESKRYNQTGNRRCWIFAGINMIKYNVAKNLNINDMDLELSINFIAFFDKLEKSNNAYENIIELDNTDLDYMLGEDMFEFPVDEGGYFIFFKSIIDKYGLVPSTYMPETYDSADSKRLIKIYTEKVKKDILYLLKLKNNNESIENIRIKKEQFLQENYKLLSMVLGEPISEFTYEYNDKGGNYIKHENMTPIKFKKMFLNLDLNEYVSIGNVPMYNKEYYKKYEKKYLGNVYNKSKIDFLNLPIEELKELVIKQLRDNMPVWFGCEMKKMIDKKSGVLDSRLYNYEKILGFTRLTKKENLDLQDICYQHCMCFIGVNIKSDKPERWKVEDSYGTEERISGCYVMNDNFFDEFVMNIIINKKYLSNKQLELLNQDAIEFGIKEPY